MDAMNRQRVTTSVIPDASVLIEEWERAAHPVPGSRVVARLPWVIEGLLWSVLMLAVLGEGWLLVLGVRWLCGCW